METDKTETTEMEMEKIAEDAHRVPALQPLEIGSVPAVDNLILLRELDTVSNGQGIAIIASANWNVRTIHTILGILMVA